MNKKRFSRIAISIPARSSLLAIGLVVLLASSFAAASTPQGHFEKTFQVSGPVDLEVQTRSGDITVRSGPAGSVSIRGKIYVGDRWLMGNRHTTAARREQHPHRLCERPRHFGGLRDHRARGHHDPHAQRIGRSDY
jgi:hypothetical protein